MSASGGGQSKGGGRARSAREEREGAERRAGPEGIEGIWRAPESENSCSLHFCKWSMALLFFDVKDILRKCSKKRQRIGHDTMIETGRKCPVFMG